MSASKSPAFLVAAISAVLAVLVAPAASSGQPPAAPPAPAAQPQGTFQMTGHVTVAHNVRGEHVGEIVQRTWTFTPQCPTAPCATVQLVRARASGTDTLMLQQTAPGIYAGQGSFSAPLRCHGQVYNPGETVPFRITVRVTAATGPVASAISARYVNRSRINLTRCIGLLGHDAAQYTGQPAGG
jgi:hypothetical protein